MANLLKGPIAKQIAKALKSAGLTLPATLTKYTPGTRTPGEISSGTQPTVATYAAQGFVDGYAAALIDGTIITTADRRITLLGASIAGGAIPSNGDQITIDGATYRVMHVDRDPASATYECQARG